MKKLLMLGGTAASVVYVGTVILGGLMRPDYSHLSMAISELAAAGAPNRSLISSLFLLYNVLLTLFGMGLLLRVSDQARGARVGRIGSIVLMLVGIAGLLMELVFPQEPGGTATTFAGVMHFVMAGVASLGTMAAIFMLAFWFKSIPALKGYFVYSLISVAVIFVSGGLSAAAMANHNPWFGLIERVTILTFTLWVFVIGLKMYHSPGNADPF